MRRSTVSPRIQALRRMAASTLIAVGLCGQTVAHDPPPEPPPLSPLTPIPPAPPSQDAGAFSRRDQAVERVSSVAPASRLGVPATDALPVPAGSWGNSRIGPDQTKPFAPFFSDISTPRDKAIIPDPRSRNVRFNDKWFAMVRRSVEQHQNLLHSLDEEIRQHPDHAEAYFQRGYSRINPPRDGDKAALDAAMADFSRAVALDPEHVAGRYWRGYVADKKKDRAAAIADYSWVIEHHPEKVGALIFRGRALMNQGEFDRAIADFDEAQGRPGVDPADVWIYRGWCYAAKGQHDRAIIDYSQAIERSVVLHAWVYEGRARSYQATGEREKALHDADRALVLEPKSVSVHELRAEILMQMGDSVGLAREADQLRELVPDQPAPYFIHAVATWQTACDRDRVLADMIQVAAWIEQTIPCASVPRLVRDFATAMTGVGRKQALADLDRCLDREPRLSLAYAARTIFNAHEGRLVASIRDATLFWLLFERKNYHPIVKIDMRNRRIYWGLYETPPQRRSAATPKGVVADIGGKCIDMGFQHLLASALGSRR